MAEKVCRKCASRFKGRRCNECHKRISREYSAKHREQVRAKAKEFRQVNGERLRVDAAARRLVDGAKIAAQKAVYAATASAKQVARVTAWRKANPSGKRIQGHNYRARKRAGGQLSPGLAKVLYAEQNGRCACCWRSLDGGYQMDHIVPLAKGGANVDENIQLLTPLCNGRKHARTMAEYEAQYGEENGYGLV